MSDRAPPEPATRPLTDDEARHQVKLLILRQGTVQTVPVARGDTLTVGRGDAAIVRVDDDSISRVHLRLDIADAVTVTDLGSSNGTRVRGARIPADTAQTVALGEQIVLGKTSLIVEGSVSPSAAPNPRAGSAMQRVRNLADRIAPSTVAVAIQGETGVGKEVLARRIHDMSGRTGSFMPINCASLSESLLESQLFGHEKGAFTGADNTKPGLLEAARGGTVFLDEVTEMPMAVQAKLLRALEDRRVFRVGGVRAIDVDVRFVSATNRDLQEAVRSGALRSDVFHRLAGLVLSIPPLRKRPRDILPLAREFVATATAGQGRTVTLTAPAEAWLIEQPWDGNVRQLRNVIERALVLGGDALTVADFELDAFPEAEPPILADLTAEQMDERSRIVEALRQTAGNQTRAAERLGVSRRTLINRIEAYAIPRPQKD